MAYFWLPPDTWMRRWQIKELEFLTLQKIFVNYLYYKQWKPTVTIILSLWTMGCDILKLLNSKQRGEFYAYKPSNRRKISLTFIIRGSFPNSGHESMCFFKSKSRYSKTKYKRFSLCTTSCNLSPEDQSEKLPNKQLQPMYRRDKKKLKHSQTMTRIWPCFQNFQIQKSQFMGLIG